MNRLFDEGLTMRRAALLVEAVGTYLLVATIGLAVATAADEGRLAIAIAVGTVLIAIIYAGAPVSGAHYNPAVTLMFFVRGRLSLADAARYVVVQVVGSCAAAITVMVMIGAPIQRVIEPPSLPAAGLGEFVFTFALCWVILQVGLSRATQNNGYFGVAIGMVVIAAIIAVGGISGAVLNPAVLAGAVTLGLASGQLWWYVLVHVAAALAAAVIFGYSEVLPSQGRTAPNRGQGAARGKDRMDRTGGHGAADGTQPARSRPRRGRQQPFATGGR